MKPLLLLTLLLLTITTHSQENTIEEQFVEIYQTHDNGLFGRSEERDILLSLKDTVFGRYNSLTVDSTELITAVVIECDVVMELEKRVSENRPLQIGFVNISVDDGVYNLQDDTLMLDISFSFEKPNQEIIEAIEDHYPSTSKYRKIVSEHYLENFVIRIHRAENILKPEAEEITYDEALIAATIIGDKDQWLWGIHDGRAYLKELLFN